MPDRREFLKRSFLLGAAAMSVSSPMISAQESSTLAETPATIPPTPPEIHVLKMQQIRKTAVPARKITIPDVEGFKVLKGDFHIHTLFSDGLVMPKDRVDEAVDNGLDVIAITDHIEYRPFLGGRAFPLKDDSDNHNRPYEIAKPHADSKKLILLRGAEITKSQLPPGHLNALFVDDINPIAAAVDDWQKMLQVTVDQGGFVLWNHPGWESQLPRSKPMQFFPEHEEAYKKGLIHGVEAFNGVCLDFYPVVLNWCNERDLAVFANSDIHQSEWNTYGHQNPLRPMTLILARERTHDAVKEAFFARRTIGFAAGMVFGRDPWVSALFRSCVDVKKVDVSTYRLKNNSDIPCAVQAGGVVCDLPPQTTRELNRAPNVEKLSVLNWMAATNQPVTIELP